MLKKKLKTYILIISATVAGLGANAQVQTGGTAQYIMHNGKAAAFTIAVVKQGK